MMQGARPWLPANAARDGTLARAIETRAVAWGARWLAKPKPISVTMQAVRDNVVLASDSICWRHAEGGFTAALAPMAHAPIAGAMLGLETGAHKLTPDDHRVLRELAQLCTRDLSVDIATLIGLNGVMEATSERRISARFRYVLQMGGATQLFEILISEERAMEARALLMGAPTPHPTPLHSRDEALARQRIQVGAMIGRGRLELGELKRLTPGDVIVLDRGPDDELDLAVNSVAIGATCSVLCDGEDLRMRIDQPRAGEPS